MDSLLSQPQTTRMNPPEDLRARLTVQGGVWQMLPDIAVKALAMARDPNCSIKEFASVVERDPKLATEILRITNSAFYGARNPIINLKQAVTRLGFAHCRNVILAASLGSAMRKLKLSEAWMQLLLWRHSVLTGMLAMSLNRRFNLGFIGEEFTAGLIHDVGRSLFAIIAPEDFAKADPLDFIEGPGVLQQEHEILRTDHCELGAWFIAQNKLPEALVEVVLMHHEPAKATEHRKLVATIAVADHMANYLQSNGSADEYDAQENPAIEVLFEASPGNVLACCTEARLLMSETMCEANSANGPFSMS
jgi:HD-like signal output (HDOD) protein